MTDLLDHPVISGRYFYPLDGDFPDPFWIDCGNARLACSYHQVDSAAKTLVHFHGNGEIVADWRGSFVHRVKQAGVNVLLAEYRGYGASTGRPQLGRMLADVEVIGRALGQPAEQLIFFGRSVGSIFAIEAAAAYPRAAGLILDSGIADVLERLLLRLRAEELGVSEAQLRQVVAERLDQQRKLVQFPGPVLVLHARHDELVEVSHGQRLYDWAGGPKEIKILPHGGHNDIMAVNAPAYFDALNGFIEKLK